MPNTFQWDVNSRTAPWGAGAGVGRERHLANTIPATDCMWWEEKSSGSVPGDGRKGEGGLQFPPTMRNGHPKLNDLKIPHSRITGV